jgi:putative endonuclease
LFDTFTRKYKIKRLLYFETFSDSGIASDRELQIKKWRREKKIALVEKSNAQREDMSLEIFRGIGIPRSARDGGR